MSEDWTDSGKPWHEFSDTEACRPGVLIEVGDKKYLIGDINPHRGVCDDCTEFDRDAIVVRYAAILDNRDWGA